ncbi:MAG: hypothetical protein ACYTFW_01350 [Planctomycetota bacterium]|jgi:hypothetical protein
MSIDNVDIIPGEQICLLDELQSLLEKQLELAHQGNSASEQVEALGKQADRLVEKISQIEILKRAEFKNQRECLKKLYDELCLAVTTQKIETAEQLSQLRIGRKTIEAYRSNI